MRVKSKNPKISIVICTYRRYELTRQVVRSFCKQSAQNDSFELIIVENDLLPHSEIRQIVKEAREKINIYYLFENSIGLSKARNAGGKAAQADYIGYIDDDALAPENYIEKYLDIIERLYPDIIGGPIYAMYDSKKPEWFRESYGSTTNDGFSGFFNSNQYISGTSIGFRRGILEEFNWFDQNLGMTGKKIWYGEETMVQIKAWRKYPDLRVWFDQGLTIKHLIPAAKMKLKGKLRRSYNSGRSLAYLWINGDRIIVVQKRAPYVLFKTILYFFIKGLPGLILHDRKKYPFWQNYVFESLSQYLASIGQEFQYTRDLFKFSKTG